MSSQKYTKEELVNELERISEKYCNGEAPRIKDMRKYGNYSEGPYKRIFGSWNQAIENTGFQRNVQFDISEKDLKEELYRISEEYHSGDSPTTITMEEKGRYSVAKYRNFFGSWNNALEECDFEPNLVTDIDEKTLLDEINRVSEICNGVPKIKDLEKHSEYGWLRYKNTFGSWNSALQEAGFEITKFEYSRKQLINKMKEISEKHFQDVAPTKNEFNKYSPYSASTYERRFGTWNNALKEANIEPKIKTNISKEDLIDEFYRVSDILFDGKAPLIEKWRQSEIPKYTAKAYRKEFGSWNAILEKCGFEKRHQSEWTLKGKEHPDWKGGVDFYYGPSWPQQKKECLERDNSKCRVCEQEVKHHYFKRPDVHHIKPKNKWNVEEEHKEMNKLSNLICLCRSCHHKFEGKWQNVDPNKFTEKAKNTIKQS